MLRYYFDDFSVGRVLELGAITLDKEAIVGFASQYDPQPFHIDEEAALDSPFGGLIASGWHTCSALMRLMCDAYILDSASIGSPGVEQIRWLKPVRVGDTLTARVEVVESRPSRSKSDRGSVLTDLIAVNQHGQTAMTMRSWCMFMKRPVA